MARSLKAVLPHVGRLLAISHHVLYVRQQALVRDGLLPTAPGRGPGSGVAATPETLATLLIALLSGVSLSDIAHQARAFSEAVAARSTCPLTGAHSLKEAVAMIIADTKTAKRVNSIMFATSHGHAFIRYDGRQGQPGSVSVGDRKFKSSTFVALDVLKSPLAVSVEIAGDILEKLSAVLMEPEVDQ